MALELVYTSAARGLRPGTRGFCTVAYTKGMSPEYVRLLEALSAYTPLYPAHDANAWRNPVAYSHCRYLLRGRSFSIVSRVAPAMADHTYRSNKIAHHLVLNTRERPKPGPAWLAAQNNVFVESWDQPPHHIAEPKPIPDGEPDGTRAIYWEEITDDAAWAAALAYGFLKRSTAPTFIVFEPGTDVLRLMREAIALLDADKRWQVTFNTYFTNLPAGATCVWRCCVPDADCLREVRRNPNANIIDLTQPLDAPPDTPLSACAREGKPLPRASRQTDDPRKRAGFRPLPNRNKPNLRMRPPRV